MNSRWVPAALLLVCFAQVLSAQNSAPWHDPSPHTVQFVNVDKDVKLEVLDWGGSGRPLVLLTGLGNSAHVYDNFAPKLISEYHVYGITRRGFGASSAPASGYSADRLGDDVLAVLDALKIEKPVLVGHSIGGEELSSVGSRHPERVAGLIYLDSAYDYAYYDPSIGNLNIDSQELQKKLEQLRAASTPQSQKQLIQELLEKNLPAFERDVREEQVGLNAPWPTPTPATASDRKNFQAWGLRQKRLFGLDMPEAELRQVWKSTDDGRVGGVRTKTSIRQAIIAGGQKYTKIPVPILAIYAIPQDYGPYVDQNPAIRDAVAGATGGWPEKRAKAFEAAFPSAHVVRLAHAYHYVFMSNEADVLREMRNFLTHLN
jgi:non-heme chloroperoxidase